MKSSENLEVAGIEDGTYGGIGEERREDLFRDETPAMSLNRVGQKTRGSGSP